MKDTAPIKRGSARERLLDLAEKATLEKGFGATSIEELIAGAGLSKSGFFHHFKDKNALAKALIERYAENDARILDAIFARGNDLSEDPLQAFLIGLKLFAETMADVREAHPGCLAASFCYQEQLFDAEVRALSRESFLRWRKRFAERLTAIAAKYPPRMDVDLDALADTAAALIDGGITLSKALKDPKILPAQALHFRAYIRLLFDPSA
jgi:TetR/AcrR family transcriptional regulator, transcriptional repressor for nem operon